MPEGVIVAGEIRVEAIAPPSLDAVISRLINLRRAGAPTPPVEVDPRLLIKTGNADHRIAVDPTSTATATLAKLLGGRLGELRIAFTRRRTAICASREDRV